MSFTNSQLKNPEEPNLKSERAGEWVPYTYTTIRRKLPVQKDTDDRRSEVVHCLTVKLFPQAHDAKYCLLFSILSL
jgi:hypothetical protein